MKLTDCRQKAQSTVFVPSESNTKIDNDMLPSRKIYMGITSAALIALGIISICRPAATIISIAWLIGLLCLVSGAANFLNWLNIRHYFPQSGSVILSSILQIILGVLLLENKHFVAGPIPFIFSFFLIFEGINLAIRSFDYKLIHFRFWWLNFLLGIAAAVLGFMSLSTPHLGSATLSLLLGCGLILLGCIYLLALTSINRFERRLHDDPWIDEQ